MRARQQLNEPLKDTLFFAGEAVDDTVNASTVAGALASGIAAARRGQGGVKKMNDIRMNLAESAECQMVWAESGLEAAAIFEDVLFGIPFRETKVQDFFATKIAYAAEPGAETVNEPGDFGQPRGLKNSQPAGLAFSPALRRRSATCPVRTRTAATFYGVRGHLRPYQYNRERGGQGCWRLNGGLEAS
jgi:hypothetical protein